MGNLSFSFTEGCRLYIFRLFDFDTRADLPGFYHPTEKYNNTAYVIGILNVKNFLHLKYRSPMTQNRKVDSFIQLKD